MLIKISVFLLLVSHAGAGFSVGLRNFRELQAHYSQATGVGSSNFNAALIYDQVQATLPQTSDVAAFSGTMVRAASALGGVYCAEFVNRESRAQSGVRRAHQGVDFAVFPAAIAPAVTTDVLAKYSQLFWGRDMTVKETTVMGDVARSLAASSPQSTAGTRQYFIGLCSIVSNALESLVIAD